MQLRDVFKTNFWGFFKKIGKSIRFGVIQIQCHSTPKTSSIYESDHVYLVIVGIYFIDLLQCENN